MERYQVELAYDGTHFLGFQRQARERTVQGVVEAALRQLGWQGKSLLAAGRTDTGVHASGQVIAFDLEWLHPASELLRALNAHLPPDVAAQSLRVAAMDFHPRFDARWRQYRYSLYCRERRHPLLARYAWQVWPAPDLDAMQSAAAMLPGTRDFAAFGAPPKRGESTIRTIFQAEWQATGDRLHFDIRGDAFLYHMVRRLVFVQVMIGKGWLEPNAIARALQNPALGTQIVRGLAPACGLALMEVHYPAVSDETSMD